MNQIWDLYNVLRGENESMQWTMVLLIKLKPSLYLMLSFIQVGLDVLSFRLSIFLSPLPSISPSQSPRPSISRFTTHLQHFIILLNPVSSSPISFLTLHFPDRSNVSRGSTIIRGSEGMSGTTKYTTKPTIQVISRLIN